MDTLQIQSSVSSERTNFTHSIELPIGSVSLRADQWILIEEALMEQSQILYDISGRNYDKRDYEQSAYLFDKSKELESLAQRVGSVIESLQANSKENL